MNSVNSFDWTPTRIETASKLWVEGKSATEIARELNRGVRAEHCCSRNAVLGKLYRLGIMKPIKASVPAKKRRGNVRSVGPAKRIMSDRADLALVMARKSGPQPPLEPVRPLRQVAAASVPTPWTERTFGQCAYPIDGEGEEVLSCCAPSKNRGPRWQYCEPHLVLMGQRPHTPAERAAIMERAAKTKRAA